MKINALNRWKLKGHKIVPIRRNDSVAVLAAGLGIAAILLFLTAYTNKTDGVYAGD